MSDIPRTDRWRKNVNGCWHYVEIERSRELERELNAANERIEALNRGNAAAERILCEAAGVGSGRDVLDWIVAAKDRIRLLIAERDTARQQADQNYTLRDEFRELLGTDDVKKGVAVVREIKDRIKRLEEAGDAMAATHLEKPSYESALYDVCAWDKAKEAKP